MALSLMDVRGMSAAMSKKLHGQGIEDSDQLLNATRTPQKRTELAHAVGISQNTVLELANRADLARVVGIGEVYADLMEKAGVDTVKELANRVPENLLGALREHNNKKRPKGRAPGIKQVTDWVNQARALPKLLEY